MRMFKPVLAPLLGPDRIPVRFGAGDRVGKSEVFMMMFRLVIGDALASGGRLKDIARAIGMPVARLSGWIAGRIHHHEIDEMSRKCIRFAHDRGLDLEAVEG
jgi:hypothetical protein